jgi:GTP-binding protein Era
LNQQPKQKTTYCGLVSIIGRPNVGKSTLMNHLIGQKISITSRKPQTTQHRVNGVISIGQYQYVFIDTPGFQKRYINKLNTLLNKSVVNSLSNIDAIVFVVEAGSFNAGDEEVLALLPKTANVFLVINKQDKIKDKHQLQDFIKQISDKYPFKGVLSVSAKQHFGLDELLAEIKQVFPIGEFLYPADQLTDKSSQFLCSEIIREKLFRYLGEELPYSLAVEINEFKLDNELYRISATIIVDKDNQKPIVIGRGGEKLKKISSEARLDMEHLLQNKVFLQVWVKVKGGFADDLKFLSQYES